MLIYFAFNLLFIFLIFICVSGAHDSKDDSIRPLEINLVADSEEELSTHFNYRPRIAILIPFIGRHLPAYFPIFLKCAQGSSSLIDFFILHNGIDAKLLGSYFNRTQNVKFINLESTHEMVNLFLRQLLDHKILKNQGQSLALPLDYLVKIVAKQFERHPYLVVEFKGALGHVFHEYISQYSHWGYTDLDVCFGDLPRWVTQEELHDFDIVTYGYGDQERVYLRGQFTFHRNIDKINQLWRACTFLSDIDLRYSLALKEKDPLKFESAEGCYSRVVIKRKDIKVKYAVKAFTDVSTTDSSYSHGIFVATGSHRDRSVIYKADSNQNDGMNLLHLPMNWFEKFDDRHPLQWEVSEKNIITMKSENPRSIEKSVNCMYWVPEQYQKDLCAINVGSEYTIFLIEGILYKKKHINVQLPKGIVSAALFHYQEWKRYYRQSSMSILMHPAALYDFDGFVITKEGVIPVLPSSSRSFEKNEGDMKSSRFRKQAKPLNTNVFNRHTISSNFSVETAHEQNEPPQTLFCLRSSLRVKPPQKPSIGCDEYVSWHHQEYVNIISKPTASWSNVNWNKDVTLALVLQLPPNVIKSRDRLVRLLQNTEKNLRIWGVAHPSILLIHVPGITPEIRKQIIETFGNQSLKESNNSGSVRGKVKDYLSSCLVAVITSTDSNYVSRKALLNMVTSTSPTRFIVSGLDIERGLFLSEEIALISSHAAKTFYKNNGSVFIIPQFHIRKEGFLDKRETSLKNNIGVLEMLKFLKEDPKIMETNLHELECDNLYADAKSATKDKRLFGIHLERKTRELWLNITSGGARNKESRSMMHLYEQLQISLIELLLPTNIRALLHNDVYPLVMFDAIGPRYGMITAQLAPEIEELGGEHCFNLFRLSQLSALGYDVQILPGAFAVSTPESRKVVATEAACDRGILKSTEVEDAKFTLGKSCFMIENNDFMDSIIDDERKRTAKSVLLWQETT